LAAGAGLVWVDPGGTSTGGVKSSRVGGVSGAAPVGEIGRRGSN
jgi:hypothetical protein